MSKRLEWCEECKRDVRLVFTDDHAGVLKCDCKSIEVTFGDVSFEDNPPESWGHQITRIR